MREKSVLVVEDDDGQRDVIVKMLRNRGFTVTEAEDPEETRERFPEMGDVDVVLLDMRLDKNNKLSLTGAHLGKEIRDAMRAWPPEFLILSGLQRLDYYQMALDLGVAAYLSKGSDTFEHVVQHVRALALRRALSVERPDALKHIREIASRSRTRGEAISMFCREILAPEFESCLGAPFLILLTERGQTQNCVGSADVPRGALPLYDYIQAVTYGRANASEPFVVDSGQLGEVSPSTQEVYRKLHGAAFLPLSISRNIHLTLGIVQEYKPALNESAEDLARILAQYFRPAVLEHLLVILSELTELNTRKKTVLREASKFCLYVGQEQLAILADAVEDDEIAPSTTSFQRLKSLAEDLRATGDLLLPLEREQGGPYPGGGDGGESEIEFGRLKEVIGDAWGEIRLQFRELSTGFSFEVREAESETAEAAAAGVGGKVAMAEDDFWLSSLRILQWMVQRKKETPRDVEPGIHVLCVRRRNRAEVIFEDRSRRIRQNLRQKLFDPFTQASRPPLPQAPGGLATAAAAAPQPGAALQLGDDIKPGLYLPLYLAKILVEVKYNGELLDQSDALNGETGEAPAESKISHRFVMSLRVVESL